MISDKIIKDIEFEFMMMYEDNIYDAIKDESTDIIIPAILDVLVYSTSTAYKKTMKNKNFAERLYNQLKNKE